MKKSKLKPHDYQISAPNEVVEAFQSGLQGVLLQSSTGSGKTFMAASIIQKMIEITQKKVLFFVHTDVLFDSSVTGLLEFFEHLDINPISRTIKPRKNAKIMVMTAQLFGARYERKNYSELLNDVGMVVIDETHFGHFDSILKNIRENYKNIKIFGMTATPKKAPNAKLQLAEIFDIKVIGATEMKLLEIGQAVPPYLVAPDVDLAGLENVGIDKKTGEYKSDELSKFAREHTVVYDQFLQVWQEFSPNTKTLAFGADIAHCIDVCEYLARHGIKAKFSSSIPPRPKRTEVKEPEKQGIEELKYQERLKNYNRFLDAQKTFWVAKNGIQRWGYDYQILINVSIFTTGFDDKTIKTIALLIPINSENKYSQSSARGKRFFDGKNFYFLLDFGGNVKRHGLPTAERDYPLEIVEKKEKSGERPMKSCPKCNQMVPASDTFCTSPVYEGFELKGYCMHHFEGKKEVVTDAKFELVTYEQAQQKVADNMRNKAEIGVSKLFNSMGGRNEGWVFYRIHEKYGIEKGFGLLGFEYLAKVLGVSTLDVINKFPRNIDKVPYINELMKNSAPM